jgi:hypothetical protein
LKSGDGDYYRLLWTGETEEAAFGGFIFNEN